MKQFSKVLSLLVMASVALATPALAKDRIALTSSRSDSAIESVANAIQVYKPVKAMESFTVKAQSSAGSVENLRKTDSGKMDFPLSTPAMFISALTV